MSGRSARSVIGGASEAVTHTDDQSASAGTSTTTPARRGRPRLTSSRRGRGAAAATSARSRRSIITASAAAIDQPEPGPSTSRGPQRPQPNLPNSSSEFVDKNTRISMSQSLNGGGYFECIICLENLDSAATINANEGNDNEAGDMTDGSGIIRRGVVGRRGGNARRAAACDPREISATSCGHMYHRYCLEKWFQEQGKKTCPSCRKNVPGKLIRLYPNISQHSAGYSPSIQFTHQPSNQHAAIPQVGELVNQPAISAIQIRQGQVEDNPARAPATVINVPNGQCGNQHCQDTQMMHRLLTEDFSQLQERNNNLTEELDVRNAQMLSLQESHDKISEELTELRAAPGSVAKRRREN